ncbi:MAG: flagellar hook-basal body complex protein [Clostridium sp.]
MIRSLYASVSGLISLENKQATISNNMTNANTNGFKSETLSFKNFKDVMIQNKDKIVGGQNVKSEIGKLSLGVAMDTVDTKFTQGDFKETGKMGDFSIDGRGFFVVQRGGERLFTRDGNFKVNNDGFLVTTTGENVLGTNKNTGRMEPIFVGNEKFLQQGDGSLLVGGRNAYKIATADFNDYKSLDKVGDNYYIGNNPIYNAEVTIYQGFIERSNVNITNEMVDMLSTMRSFETNQKFISMIDESLGKACNEIGAIR